MICRNDSKQVQVLEQLNISIVFVGEGTQVLFSDFRKIENFKHRIVAFDVTKKKPILFDKNLKNISIAEAAKLAFQNLNYEITDVTYFIHPAEIAKSMGVGVMFLPKNINFPSIGIMSEMNLIIELQSNPIVNVVYFTHFVTCMELIIGLLTIVHTIF